MLIMAAPQVCSDLREIWQVLGWVLMVFKIVIPILIIVFGMIDLGKAVVASKDDEIKKAIKSLAMRAVAGVVIFFIPILVGAIFGLVDSFQEVKGEYKICQTCITSPGKCGSSKDYSSYKTEDSCTSNGGSWDRNNSTCD